MKTIKLTVEYKNGKKLDQIGNYVDFSEGAIYFQIKQ